MPKFCERCGRPKGAPYHFAGICDQVRLNDGRVVMRNRVEVGGDLHDEIHEFGLKVVSRNLTAEMRSQIESRGKAA